MISTDLCAICKCVCAFSYGSLYCCINLLVFLCTNITLFNSYNFVVYSTFWYVEGITPPPPVHTHTRLSIFHLQNCLGYSWLFRINLSNRDFNLIALICEDGQIYLIDLPFQEHFIWLHLYSVYDLYNYFVVTFILCTVQGFFSIINGNKKNFCQLIYVPLHCVLYDLVSSNFAGIVLVFYRFSLIFT